MNRIASLFLLLLLSFSLRAETANDPAIFGVWQLVEFKDWNEQGQMIQPFGEEPAGQFIYTPSGKMSVQIMSVPSSRPLRDQKDDNARIAAAKAYIGYFGRFTADAKTNTLVHQVTGALLPNRVGHDYPRKYSIENNILTIEIQTEDGRKFVRKLKKVESFK